MERLLIFAISLALAAFVAVEAASVISEVFGHVSASYASAAK